MIYHAPIPINMMKRFFTRKKDTILLLLLLLGGNAFAAHRQVQDSTDSYVRQADWLKFPHKWMEALDSRHYYSLGVDYEDHLGGMMGIEGMYDARILPKFTFGVYGGVAFEKGNTNKRTQLHTGFRINFFPWGLCRNRSSRLEPFVCVNGGLNIDKDRDDFYELEYDLSFGARYRIAKNWAIYTELGSDVALGCTFMMR